MLNSKEFVRELQLRHESAWMNPNVGSAETALAALPLTRTDVDDAEARLERARSDELLQAVLADLRGLRGALYADAGSEPPPPHY